MFAINPITSLIFLVKNVKMDVLIILYKIILLNYAKDVITRARDAIKRITEIDV
jgi:hypothetical protein